MKKTENNQEQKAKKLILTFLLIFLLWGLGGCLSAQNCNTNWSIGVTYRCVANNVANSKLVIFKIKNPITKENPDSVTYKISNQKYKNDSILLEEGMHNIKIKIYKNNEICKIEKNIKVPKKYLKASFLLDDYIYCEEDLIKIINTSGPGMYQSIWNFGDGRIIKNIKHPVYQFKPNENDLMPNIQYIFLTVIDMFGCRDSVVENVVIYKNELKKNMLIDSYNKEEKKVELKIMSTDGFFMYYPSKYLWSTKETSESILIDKGGYYWLKISDEHSCWSFINIYIDDNQIKHPKKYYGL